MIFRIFSVAKPLKKTHLPFIFEMTSSIYFRGRSHSAPQVLKVGEGVKEVRNRRQAAVRSLSFP
jgi:hypothetical protein